MDFSRDMSPSYEQEGMLITGFIMSSNPISGLTRVMEQKGTHYWVVKEYYKPNVCKPKNVFFSDVFKCHIPKGVNQSKSVAWNRH